MAINFPIIDYHVHQSGDLNVEQAVALADERGMKFGIVEHPGAAYGITTDAELRAYIQRLRAYPVYAGLQPMYVGWSQDFSAEAIGELDYVLMDADTVPLDDGTWLSIWRHDNFIEDMDAFVERYLAHIENILTTEPIHIFARPTYLPINFARHYDDIWTEARMRMIINLAKARDIALEIAENVRVPNLTFVQMAKAAGIKFTFGTNARNQNAGNFYYCIEMAEKAGLTRGDMFFVNTYGADKQKTIAYVTYENYNNPHITIHCDGCSQIKKHGGEHKYNQGKYERHATYQDAKVYASKTGLPVKNCSFCSPPDCTKIRLRQS